jgi:transposase
METDATQAEQSETTRTSSRTSGGGSRIELITRGEPRRRWPLEQKQAIAAESFQSGVSPTAVARRYGISSGLLYAWRKALLAAQPAASSGSGTRFARVEVARSVKRAAPGASVPLLAAEPAGVIEIVLPDGIIVRVDQQIDPRALRRVLSVLDKR